MLKKLLSLLFYGEAIQTNISGKPQGINHIEIPDEYLTNFPHNDLNKPIK